MGKYTDRIVVLDFGGQYTQHIARKVRNAGVFSEVMPYWADRKKIAASHPTGIIFTGDAKSTLAQDAPLIAPEIFELGVPVMGICYGMQAIVKALGGKLKADESFSAGNQQIIPAQGGLLKEEGEFFMSRGDQIIALPEGFAVTAKTRCGEIAAIENADKGIYGVQFHPETENTGKGETLIKAFLFDVCHCVGDWNMEKFARDSIEEIREKVGDGRALCALSGGVDSSVCAALMHRAIGDRLTCIFVDTGLMRKNEGDQVCHDFGEKFGLNLIRVDAEDRFLARLKGVLDPEKKRKIIGEEFIRVFEEEGRKIGSVDFLVQGTIYPDVLESGMGHTGVIKSHHNVGGLPDVIDFKSLIEPVKDLFKDEVRALGTVLGMPEEMVWRQPFPGPGLSVRCIGEVNKEKLDILRDADAIFREEIRNAGLDRDIWQYFAVITDVFTTGVHNDHRTYDRLVALRAILSVDAMTADIAKLDYPLLLKVSNRIITEVNHVNRVVYDITQKPPGTIEWE